jgi:hypothetical protein
LRKKIRQTQTLLKLDGVLGHGADSRWWSRHQYATAGGSKREPAESRW